MKFSPQLFELMKLLQLGYLGNEWGDVKIPDETVEIKTDNTSSE